MEAEHAYKTTPQMVYQHLGVAGFHPTRDLAMNNYDTGPNEPGATDQSTADPATGRDTDDSATDADDKTQIGSGGSTRRLDRQPEDDFVTDGGEDHRLGAAEPTTQDEDAGPIGATTPGPAHRLREAAKQLRLFRERAKAKMSASERELETLARAEYLIRGVADARGDRDE